MRRIPDSSEIVGAFGRRETDRDCTDGFPEGGSGASDPGPQQGLQFSKGSWTGLQSALQAFTPAADAARLIRRELAWASGQQGYFGTPFMTKSAWMN